MSIDVDYTSESTAPSESILAAAATSLFPRAVLEGQWRREMDKLTQLSIRLHEPDVGEPSEGDTVDRCDQTELTATSDAVRAEMQGIEDALDRLARGTYGSCESCTRTIDPLRLAGLPATRICRRCSASLTRSG